MNGYPVIFNSKGEVEPWTPWRIAAMEAMEEGRGWNWVDNHWHSDNY